MRLMKINRRLLLWLCCLAVMVGVTWWIISGLEERFESIDVITDEKLLETEAGLPVSGSEVELDEAAFFDHYRLQRERTRDRSIEMLQSILDNPNAGAAAKEEAEKMLLEIVQLREQELVVENMIKAQGYEDAIFFYHDEVATVLVKHKGLDEKSFIQIAETVSAAVGVERENIQVMARP
ncbi:MAG: SpoIIIAH-like family protein [Firmicutes bacterium]|nr:SpoIIIAH-like family protein [Bacillota bacterium]HPU00267.1 SpoIIIAH-like family protein [Bacillota bacterium]